MIGNKIRLLSLLFPILFLCFSLPVIGQGKKSNSGKVKLPIDGEWTNAWNEQVIITKGRLYKLMIVEVPMKKIKVELDILHEISASEPGLYTAFECSDYKKKIFDYPVTIKIIDENKILAKSERQDIVYTKVKLRDNRSYLDELEMARQNYLNSIKNKITILDFNINPDLITPNDNFVFSLDYKVYFPDVKEDVLPVKFYYEIQKAHATLYKSTLQHIETKNDADMHWEVKLRAAKDTGSYQINVYLRYDTCTTRGSASFIISDPELVASKLGIRRLDKSRSFLEQVTGKYKMVVSGFEEITELFTITKENDKLQFQFDYKPKEVKNVNNTIITTFKKIRLIDYKIKDFKLIYTFRVDVKVVSTSGFTTDVYSIYRNTIDFNYNIDEAPVNITAIEGDYVHIGEVYKGTLVRIE